MFCKYCGRELDESFKLCPYCGGAVEDDTPAQPAPAPQAQKANASPPTAPVTPPPAKEDAENLGGIKVLGFFLGFFGPVAWFLPLISLVLYFVWRGEKKRTASAIGRFTIIGLISGIGLGIVVGIIAAILFTVFAAVPLFEFLGGLIGDVLSTVKNFI